MSGQNQTSSLLVENLRGLSKERRKFLIVNVFDCVTITLLWLLSTVSKTDGDWPSAFLTEINILEPRFLQTSLFDLVIVGILRMLILLFFYAFLSVDHWLPVAFTTAITTMFVTIKILFFFSKSHGSMPQYLVIIASLFIAWFELWLMPFRVLNQERDVAAAAAEGSNTHLLENSPRLSNTGIQTSNGRLLRATDNEEERPYHSAIDFSTDDDGNTCLSSQPPGIGRVTHTEAILAVERAQIQGRILLNKIGSWRLLNKNPEIRLLDSSGNADSYYVRAEFEWPNSCTAALFQAIWSDSLKWNSQILDSRVLSVINPNTEIIYSRSAPACGGYISSREFVDVRRSNHDPSTNIYEIVYTSVECKLEPVAFAVNAKSKDGHLGVRGKNGVNIIRISPSAPTERGGSVTFEWVMNSELRGKIPKVLTRSGMSSFLVGYVKSLDNYLKNNA
ncbi:cholesterol-capturing domain-containing protein [Ditylenchus destructor]|uniref:Cholesterol-capturing domain-containing protein n=1 Tax=Ditylenchus destructor TaxID=166010 RepID=A0AAD4R8H1_9BILA|nr:cholesterol-capturing domain-containing protein [Ditylenchus destructor]